MKMKNLNPILEHQTLNQNPRRKSALTVLAWLALLLAAGPVQAGTLWWDGGTTNIGANGDGLSAGGNGIWNTTLMNWDQGAGLAHVAWNNAKYDTAVFGGSGGTVTLGTDITLGGLQFEGASSTRGSGGTLKVTGTLNPYAGAYVDSGTLHYNSPGGVTTQVPKNSWCFYSGSKEFMAESFMAESFFKSLERDSSLVGLSACGCAQTGVDPMTFSNSEMILP
ncbi:MAG: hypothetical protein NTW21_08075 [Verrucomicrobia bacterium]|nr:hypothetical protein [Verrucomicrobiota bacterium]